MDKLEVGMYVRTDTGQIVKNYGEFYEPAVDIGLGIMEEIEGIWVDNRCLKYIDKKYIVKASYDITDLIEKDDILTFKNDKDVYRVSAIPNEESGLKDFYLVFEYGESLGLEDIRVTKKEMQEQLESIMTHEKFGKERYKIGEK